MSALDNEPFPRGALIAVSALIGFSVVATGAARLAKLSAPTPSVASQPAPARSVDVRFVDETDGSVSITDSHDNRRIALLAPGTNGFARSVMRGLVHERKRRGLGPEQPFRVAQWNGGRLSLEDPATGRVIDLDAFGAPNEAVFADLLPARGVAS